MRTKLSLLLPKCLLVGVSYLLLSGTCFAQAAMTTHQQFDFPQDFDVFVPCGAGGTGEVVHITGTVHDSITVTINGKNLVVQSSGNFQNGLGIGLTTGDTYHATTGADFVVINALSVLSFPATTTLAQSFNLIGTTSTAGKLITTLILHVTVNADGTITANVVDQFTQCQ
jgi:hypothetical protein